VLTDMKARAQELGAPDLIFFTGDLSYSGQSEQFERVTGTLNEVRAIVGGDPIVVTVPGNHDLTWPRIPDGTFRYYLRDETIRRGFLENAEKRLLAFLEERFAGYLEWWKREVTSDWDYRSLTWKPGLLPGDFCLTVPCKGLRLGLLGINSAWLQLDRSVQERQLAVEIEQFSQAGIDVPRWVQDHDACLILMHHPPWWLEQQREQDFRTNIYSSNWFIACLFGHMHEQRNTEERISGQQRLWLQASSLLGLEHYGEASKEQRVCGYDWGRLQRIAPTRGKLWRWKRRADRTGGGDIAVDRLHGETECEELDVVLRPGAHRSPDRMASLSIPSPKQAWKGLAVSAATHVLEEAEKQFAAGELRAARTAAREQIQRWEQMNTPGRDQDHGRVVAKLYLFEALCSLCLQDLAVARTRASNIDDTVLGQDDRILLAQILAQLDETVRAREVIADISGDAAEAARQLIEVEEGRIPDALANEPTLHLRAAMHVITRGRHDLAAHWALGVRACSPEHVATTAVVVSHLLTALEWSMLDVPSGCIPVARELRPAIITFLQEHLEPGQPSRLAKVVEERQLADWSARFHQLCYDNVRLRRARAWLEELGEDTSAFQPLRPGRKAIAAPEDFEKAPPWHELYNQAIEHALQNRLDNALTLLRDAIEQFPNRMLLLYEAAQVCGRMGLLEPALDYARSAFHELPGHGQAILLARVHLASGNSQAVWNELRSYLHNSPSVAARRILAKAAMDVTPAEAPAYWQRVIDLPEATASDRVGLAMSWHRQHDPQKAAELAWDVFRQQGDDLTSDELWRCAVLQLHTIHPGARDRVIQIALALRARSENSGDDKAARRYLDLDIYLGSPASLPAPDLRGLEQAGVLKRLRQDDVLAWLRLRNMQQQQVLELYFRGEVPIEAITATLHTPEAGFISWLLHNKLPLSTPLEWGVRHDEVDSKHVLLGFFELLILDELELLEAFDRALGKQGRLLLFKDVTDVIDAAPTRQLLNERPHELDRAHALRTYLQKHHLLPPSADQDDGDWSREHAATLVRVTQQNENELPLAVLVRALVSAGHLERGRAEQILEQLDLYGNTESQTIKLPAEVALDAGALTVLWTQNALEELRVALPQRLRITPRAWRALERDIAQLDIERDARRRADRVHAWLADMRRRGRILPPIERPLVDLPSVRAGNPEAYRSWMVQAASWGEALARHQQIWLLSTDAIAAELFNGHLPVHPLSSLQWRDKGEIYRHHERVARLHDRKLSFVAVVRRLARHTGDETVRRLQELGFTNVYSADALLNLAEQFGGLVGPRVNQILEDIEARSREDVHWRLAHIALAELYTEVIWKAWCERESAYAESVTQLLLSRLAGIDLLNPEPLLLLAFQSLWEQAIQDFPASFAPVAEESGVVAPSSDSSAGQLWRCIARWVGDDAHRGQLISRAGVEVVLVHERHIAASRDLLLVAPLLVAIDVFEDHLSGANARYAPLRHCIDVLSALWENSPLEKLTFHGGDDKQPAGEISKEEMLVMAAQHPLARPHDNGIEWTAFVDIGSTPHPLPGLLPAALLLRAKPKIRVELAQYLAEREGPDDGRVVEPLLTIAARPEDVAAFRAYALLAVQAPWRQFRIDPLVIRLWGMAVPSSCPATIGDLRALLSELEPLPDDGQIEEFFFARANGGTWHERPDLIYLLERSGHLLGHPAWPLTWRSQPDSPANSVESSFARLERPADQPAARLAFDLLVCCMAGIVDEDLAVRERVSAALPDALATAIEPPPESLAAHEPDILRTAARVVWHLGGSSQSLRNRLWLTWSLHQWFLRQIEALPEVQRPAHIRTLASAWLDDSLPDEPDLLDPSRFGRGRLDHRLLAILHLLGGLKPEALRMLMTPAVQEILEGLSKRELTPEEHEVEALAPPGSCLGWHEEIPRTVPALATFVLASLDPPNSAQ
jgi:hypothetical protein